MLTLAVKHKVWLGRVGILIILILAAYLRLNEISGYMTFLGDEGRDVLVVKRMIVDHKFTLLGPTASVGGFFLGPIYYYFMLPFLWIWKLDPTGPAVMVALFGIATVYLVYKLGRELFNEWAALAAASLYALSPVVIAYSRSSWNPNLVPFFSTLLIYLLWRTVKSNHWRLLFVIGVILGIGLQLHYLFLFLFPVVGIWFLLYGRLRKYLVYYALGIMGFLVGYASFLAFELRHGFPNTQSMARFILSGKDTGFSAVLFLKTIGDVAFRLFGRLVFRLPQTEIWGNFPKWEINAWMLGTYLAILLGIFLLMKYARAKQAKNYVLLAVWFVATLILFGFYKKAIYDYYFGIFFSLPFFLVAMIWFELRKIRWGVILSAASFLGLVVLNWQGRPFLYPPNNQLAQVKEIARVALEKTDSKSFNFALITATNSDHAYRYFFEIWGHPPVTIETEQNDPRRLSVTDQLIVICETPGCRPLGNPLWEVAGFGRAEIVGQWSVPFVEIFKLVHYKGEL